MSLDFTTERQVATAAVRRACGLTASVFNKLVKNETLTKGDKSPVTGEPPICVQTSHRMLMFDGVGDFAAQAVVNVILGRAFPSDAIVGEEDATDLRSEQAAPMRDRIVALANEALSSDLSIGDMAEWGIGPGSELPPDALLDAIDRGTYAGGRTGRRHRSKSFMSEER
jgi:3'(2'), 5'-bisphosphate nucleotidase